MVSIIKNIVEKIKLWWKNFFKKKKKIIKKNKHLLCDDKTTSRNKKYVLNINLNNDDKASSIGTFYPQLYQRNKYLLQKKTNKLKKRIIGLDIYEKNQNIKIIDNIIDTINESNLYINQAIEINTLLNTINNDQELNLNTNEKLNILKENISTIIDKKLDDYETSILKKAYHEYDSVNYVIITTILIDDIIDEINQLNEDFQKNKYSQIEYERKIKKIKEKISKLETINNRKEVQDEIEKLRKDFYTKRKDKYDLLYNEEVFVNLNKKCDELLDIIYKKEKINSTNILIENAIEIENNKRKKEENEEKKIRKKKQEKIEQEYNENVIKRFIDMEFAHKFILLREKNRKILTTKEEIIKETLNYYNEFIIGEIHEFNFERNKIKTEVTKLYNDITSTICCIEKKEFIPLEHINIKLEDLTQATLERQLILNDMIHKKHNYRMEENETSKNVTTKLNNILTKEKSKEQKDNKDQKTLKKEFKMNIASENNK